MTKGDAAPPSAAKNSDNISVLTGETRESKAKAYAAEESKKVASQYVGTISNLTSKLEDTSNAMVELEAKLVRALSALNSKNEANDKKSLPYLDVAMEGQSISSTEVSEEDQVKCLGVIKPILDQDQVSSEDESSKQSHESDSSSDNEIQASSPFRKKNDSKDCFIGTSSASKNKKHSRVTPPPKIRI